MPHGGIKMKRTYYLPVGLSIIVVLAFTTTLDKKKKETEEPLKATLVKSAPDRPLKISQQLSAIQAPEGSIIDIGPKLKERAANGDDKSALALYLKLSLCETALHNQISPDEIKAYASAGISMEKFAESAEKNINQCVGVSEDDMSNRGKWLEAAAMGGNLQAKLLYASDPEAIVGDATSMLRNPDKVIAYKGKAVKFLSEAASAGNPEGLMKMGDAYNDGVLLPKDPVKAYAFYRATQMTTPNVLSTTLSQMELELTPAQISKGNEEALSIYKNCCS